MPTVDPRVDAYIEKSAAFAKPILTHIRKLVHKACPEVTETLKWSMPSFEYKGMLCGFAAFKQHCAVNFWKQSLLETDAFPKNKTAMGSFGRITSLDDLPSDKVMIDLIKQAAALNDNGVKVPKKPAAPKEGTCHPEGAHRGSLKEQERKDDIRQAKSEPSEGIRRVDNRSQDRADAKQAVGNNRRLAIRRQEQKLEIREVLVAGTCK